MTLTAQRNAYKFANHDRVAAEPPSNSTTRLLDKAFGDEPLTREEKDRIADTLYGTFGSQSSTYKLHGWAWPLYQAKQIRRILANVKHYGWQEYYAPDKSSLRRANPHRITEMVYIKKR